MMHILLMFILGQKDAQIFVFIPIGNTTFKGALIENEIRELSSNLDKTV